MNNNIYGLAKEEKNTYDLISSDQKEKISDLEVLDHWNIRAKRDDVQAVMSARHNLNENEKATIELQNEIKSFLGDLIVDKRIFELGVGIGRMTEFLAKCNSYVYGIDFSEIMLNRAKENLKNYKNIQLFLGKISDLDVKIKFDIVFESIVLLHILNPEELSRTIEKMKELSDNIFIVEHTFESDDFPISRYAILRKPEEYENIFKPYKLVKIKEHLCAGDKFTLMLFKKI